MAITYEMIKSVNERMNRIDVRRGAGKKYACVSARIQAFRELYPEGTICTEHEFRDDMKGVYVVFTARVFDGDKLLATGTAYEREGSSQVNSTSFIENAETSAVGRALGFLGIGSEDSIASAEEVSNAMHQQEAKPKADDQNAAVMFTPTFKSIAEIFKVQGYDVKAVIRWLEKRHGCPIGDMSEADLTKDLVDAKANAKGEQK